MTATAEMCIYCFDSLLSYLDSRHHPPPKTPSFTDESFPLFVTWKKKIRRRSNDSELRGCIGTFKAKKLHAGLSEFAVTSAVRDSRWNQYGIGI
eukprot:TRINITY_DN2432_c0_g1_i2.p1 TRINITY_DN2432_c0_g1~~TRINITY_DN2432_c0_g1_i2.p1  ORF type:complete len:109 (-),score=15.64 TRINITY_DN2432_c0_g1_i2:277-558(-)